MLSCTYAVSSKRAFLASLWFTKGCHSSEKPFLTLPSHRLDQMHIICSTDGLMSLPQFIYFFNLFLIGEWLLYNVVLLSAIQQHESAVSICISPPSWTYLPRPTPSHSPRLPQRTRLSSLHYTATSHERSVLHMVTHVFPCYSLSSSRSLLPSHVPKSVLYIHVCSCPANRSISTIFPDSICVY